MPLRPVSLLSRVPRRAPRARVHPRGRPRRRRAEPPGGRVRRALREGRAHAHRHGSDDADDRARPRALRAAQGGDARDDRAHRGSHDRVPARDPAVDALRRLDPHRRVRDERPRGDPRRGRGRTRSGFEACRGARPRARGRNGRERRTRPRRRPPRPPDQGPRLPAVPGPAPFPHARGAVDVVVLGRFLPAPARRPDAREPRLPVQVHVLPLDLGHLRAGAVPDVLGEADRRRDGRDRADDTAPGRSTSTTTSSPSRKSTSSPSAKRSCAGN